MNPKITLIISITTEKNIEQYLKNIKNQLLENIEKIGQVKLRPFSLWMLAPAQNLEDIYEEITRDKGSSGLRFIETYKLVDDIFPV